VCCVAQNFTRKRRGFDLSECVCVFKFSIGYCVGENEKVLGSLEKMSPEALVRSFVTFQQLRSHPSPRGQRGEDLLSD